MKRARMTARWLGPALLGLCGLVHAQPAQEEPPGAARSGPAFPAGTEPATSLRAPVVEAQAAALEDMDGGAAAEYDRGVASWYGPRFHGRATASGEPFDMHALTAAHPTLPFGTVVRVRSLVNDRVVHVRINDRGPYTGGRIIDLSRAAAVVLGLIQSGTGTKPVELSLPGGNRGEVRSRQRRLVNARRNSAPVAR